MPATITVYTEEQMLHAYRQGSEAGFTAIFKLLYPACCFYSQQITHNPFAAEEIAATAFIKIWERPVPFAHFNSLKSYLYTAVRNSSIDWLRMSQRQRVDALAEINDIQHTQPSVAENLMHAELIRELEAAIQQLPAQRKKVIQLIYQKGKSVKEVASELNLSASTVKEHKKEGLLKLKKLFPLTILLAIVNLL